MTSNSLIWLDLVVFEEAAPQAVAASIITALAFFIGFLDVGDGARFAETAASSQEPWQAAKDIGHQDSTGLCSLKHDEGISKRGTSNRNF